jgi:phage protein D
MTSDASVLVHVWVGEDGQRADIGDQIRRVDIEDIDRGSDKATILLDNQASANSQVLQRGMRIRIDLGWVSEYAFLFDGRIHSRRDVTDSRTSGLLELTCLDRSVDLNRAPTQPGRLHTGSLRDIVTVLADESDLQVGGVALDPMPSWDEERPLNQINRTAWRLLQDLAETYRSRAFVEVNGSLGDDDTPPDGEAKLYFMSETALISAAPVGRLGKCHGFSELIEFQTRDIGSGAAPIASVTVTDPETGAPVSTPGAEPPPASPAAISPRQVAELAANQGETRAAEAEAATEIANAAPVQPADTLARRRIEGAPSNPAANEGMIQRDPTRVLGLYGEGTTTGSVYLRAKGSVLIEGIGTGQDGQWYLRRVNHVIERTSIDGRQRSTYRTRFQATR